MATSGLLRKIKHALATDEQCGDSHGQFMERLGVGRSVRQVPEFGMGALIKVYWRLVVRDGLVWHQQFAETVHEASREQYISFL